MPEPIIYVDRSAIRAGRMADLERAMTEVASFVEEREPQLLSYGFYIDEEASQMIVVAIHPDAASMEYHMEVGGPRFRGFAELIDLHAIEVYGEPSDKALDQLRQKAEALGKAARVSVHRLKAGFTRIVAPEL